MTRTIRAVVFVLSLVLRSNEVVGFAGLAAPIVAIRQPLPSQQSTTPTNQLMAVPMDLETVGLVAGQENLGLAIVCLAESVWSLLQAPSVSNAKVMIPAIIAAVLLVAVAGPMIGSGDASSVGTGLWIATGVSVGLGLSYVVRLTAPYSPSPKEAAAFGLLVAVAGFFSFSQNLVVDGFLTLPSIPSIIPMPQGDGNTDYNAIMNMRDPFPTATE